MAATKFTIPEEFSQDLHYVDSLDPRSDSEILDSFTKYVPISSEKNIWGFWDKGVHAMPAWCQRNVINWVRLHGPSWRIRILDTVPGSPNHALNWFSAEDLPEALSKGTVRGHKGPHSADFLRGITLYQFGGVWMDVGSILWRKWDDIWDKLEDPDSPYQISGPWMYEAAVANHMIASRKGDPFIKRWHEIFVELWKGRESSDGLITHPLLAFAANMDYKKIESRGFNWEWAIPPPATSEYIAQILAWMRLTLIEEPNGGFNGVNYAANNIFYFDAKEDWPAETKLNDWKGQPLYDALATKLDAPKDSEAWKKAYKLVWSILAEDRMQKVIHSGGLQTTPCMGELWDKDEHERGNFETDTFAELLRYGSVHFEQTRRVVKEIKTDKPYENMILMKGILEP